MHKNIILILIAIVGIIFLIQILISRQGGNSMELGENAAKKVEKVFQRTTKSTSIHEAILYIENSNGDFSYSKGYGDKELDSPMLMASITKLFTTTCILALVEQDVLSLDDKAADYLDEAALSGLHVLDSKEYSFDLTLSDLLFQTSGLPDSFEDGSNNKDNATMSAIINEDVYLSFDDALAETKALTPQFIPNASSKAYYANINFDILGEIIEMVTNMSLDKAFKEFIFDPLALQNTYLPTNESDFIPNAYYKDEQLCRPQLIMSSKASGGCVTTARELMIFIKAFWGGELFEESVFKTLSVYRKLQSSKGPINYGGGYMQIPLGGITTFFMGKGELLGHSGSTGAFAFYYPDKDLFIVGDLNQMAKPALPIRLVIQLAMSV